MHEHRPKLTSEVFAGLVEQAIARIPEEFRRRLDNMIITVKDRPSPELLDEMGFLPDEPLFGVFLGVPLPERSPHDPPLYPDIIHIFQEPLEAYCETQEELIDEIEITVIHEIAHFIGFNDEDLARLGYD